MQEIFQKVREELRDLYLNCKKRTESLAAAVSGDPVGSEKYVHLLIMVAIPLLKSPLVSPLAYNVFRSFRNAAFEPSEDYLRKSYRYCSAICNFLVV